MMVIKSRSLLFHDVVLCLSLVPNACQVKVYPGFSYMLTLLIQRHYFNHILSFPCQEAHQSVPPEIAMQSRKKNKKTICNGPISRQIVAYVCCLYYSTQRAADESQNIAGVTSLQKKKNMLGIRMFCFHVNVFICTRPYSKQNTPF